MPKGVKKNATSNGAKEDQVKERLDRLERLLDTVTEATDEPNRPVEPEIVAEGNGVENLLEEIDFGDDNMKALVSSAVTNTDVLLETRSAVPNKGLFTELHETLRENLKKDYGEQVKVASVMTALSKRHTELMKHATANLAAAINEMRANYDGDLAE